MRSTSLFFLFLFISFQLCGQRKPASVVQAQKVFSEFTPVEVFEINSGTGAKSREMKSLVSGATVMKYNRNTAKALLEYAPSAITLFLPSGNGRPMIAELVKQDLFAPDFKAKTASGAEIIFAEGLHYQGIIKDDPHSLAAISFFNDEAMGFVANNEGNHVIGKLKDNSGDHIIYNDAMLKTLPDFSCHTEDPYPIPYSAEQLTEGDIKESLNCIRLYWELNYNIYQIHGSVTATMNFATGIFNQCKALYSNDNIPVSLSEIFIWDIPAPYTSTSASGLLSQFKALRSSFNADLGTLIGFGGGGMAAGFSGLCATDTDESLCYSGIASSYQTIPVYSWTVQVITHEQGHLMGSRHTHACVWNGNATAIDACGPAAGYAFEGNCNGASIPVNGGTIMSYCHLIATGINFTNGFGQQPSAVIKSNYNNASCLVACGGLPCPSPLNPEAQGISASSATFTWDSVPGATGYIVEYRPAGAAGWQQSVTTGNSFTVLGLSDGTDYEWNVFTQCGGQKSVTAGIHHFTTVPLLCREPVTVNTIKVTATTARIAWEHVAGASDYTIQYRIAGAANWNSCISISNKYLIAGLLPRTDYEWRVRTHCIGNDTSVFSAIRFFTTSGLGLPESTVVQPDAACGKDAVIASCSTCGFDDLNFGNSPEFIAMSWTVSGSSSNARSLLQFDLSDIPAGSQILNAKLSLYFDPLSSNGQHHSSAGNNDAIISKITSPWDELLVNWNMQPSTASFCSSYVHQSHFPTEDYIDLDVTQLVQSFTDNPEENFGMMLRLINEQPYNRLIFASSDHPDASLHPMLEVSYRPSIVECAELKFASCHGVDAMIQNCIPCGYNSRNFGSAAEINCTSSTQAGNTVNARSLIYWDLSHVPVNAVIQKASLSLYTFQSPEYGQHSALSGPNDAWLRKVTSPWNEETVTWNNMPSTTPVNQVHLAASTDVDEDYKNIDVTHFIQDFVSDPINNSGLMLQLADEHHYRQLVFASSDHPDPSKHPLLEFCYYIPVGITEVSDANEIRVMQDESNGLIRFMNPREFAGEKLIICNTAGQIIYRKDHLNGKQHEVPGGTLAPGMYAYSVSSPSKNITGRIVMHASFSK